MYNLQGMKILSAVCNSLLLALPTIKTFSLALHVLTTRDNFHTNTQYIQTILHFRFLTKNFKLNGMGADRLVPSVGCSTVTTRNIPKEVNTKVISLNRQ